MGTKICRLQIIWTIIIRDNRKFLALLEVCFCGYGVPMAAIRIVSKTRYGIFFPCPISHSLPTESSPYPEVLSSRLIKPRAAQQQTPDIVFPIPSVTVEFKLIQCTKVFEYISKEVIIFVDSWNYTATEPNYSVAQFKSLILALLRQYILFVYCQSLFWDFRYKSSAAVRSDVVRAECWVQCNELSYRMSAFSFWLAVLCLEIRVLWELTHSELVGVWS